MAFQSNFLERIPPVTRSLLIVNVIMFVATLINENFMIGTFAMFYPASPLFRWWLDACSSRSVAHIVCS